MLVVAHAFFLYYSQVGWHPVHKDSRCFHIIRSDESVEDFSYRKCILRALEIVDPGKFRIQKKKWLGQDDIVELKKSQKTNLLVDDDDVEPEKKSW